MRTLIQFLAAWGMLITMVGCLKVGDPVPVQIDSSPKQVERGRYLSHHVSVCMDCHSTRNWDFFSAPIVPGTEGQGGEAFTEAIGLPGNIYSKNITPTRMRSWTDGELVQAITEGYSKEHGAQFPIMPYPWYGTMTQEDAHAVVAYLRTLPPLQNEVPDTELNFPLNIIVRTMPRPATPTPTVNPNDELSYGKYLTTIAACEACHTPTQRGDKIEGLDFAGGFKFPLPSGGTVFSSNITPDSETGIGSWSREQFIQKFKSFASEQAQNQPVSPNTFNTVMPWTMYAGMTEQDLGAIYTYLRSLQPVNHPVTTFVPAP